MGTEDLYYIRGNAMDIRGGCALNGLPVPCSLVNEAIASETSSVALEYQLNDGSFVPEQGKIHNIGAGLFLFDVPHVVLDTEPGNTLYRVAWRTGAFYLPQNPEEPNDCLVFAAMLDIYAQDSGSDSEFVKTIYDRFKDRNDHSFSAAFNEREKSYAYYVTPPPFPGVTRVPLPPTQSQQADMNLNGVAVPIGFWLGTGTIKRTDVGNLVRQRICN